MLCFFFLFIFYHATELAVQRGQGVRLELSIPRQDLSASRRRPETKTWVQT